MRPTRIRKEQLRGLADVAFSGDYNDLENKPVIPEPTSVRTMNGEQLTDSSLGDINIHDGFYFPNAAQDYDGNWYGAVVIGDQVWLAENLRTTHYADGTAIANGTGYATDATPYYYYPNLQSSNKEEFGLLYNYNAVMNGGISNNNIPSGVQGISPIGWHVPSLAEFEKMLTYVGNQKRYKSVSDSNLTVNKAISTDKNLWSHGSNVNGFPSCLPQLNNKTLFGAKPAGMATGSKQYYYAETARFKTTTIINGIYKSIAIQGFTGQIDDYIVGSTGGLFAESVRCVSDLTPIQFRNWYVETYGSMQHHLPQSAPAGDIVTYFFDGTDVTDSDGNTVTAQAIANSADAGKIVLLGYGGKCYTLGDYEMSGTPQEMVFVAANYSANHGDVASLDYLYYNSNDGWDSDRIYLQERLVASGADQNIKTINLLSLLGSGNITLLPPHTLHTRAITIAGSSPTVRCEADERAFYIVDVNAANCTLNIDILNGWDNTVFITGNQNINIVFKVNGVQATTIFERHDYFSSSTANLSKAVAIKFVIEVVDNKVFVDVDDMDSFTPSV